MARKFDIKDTELYQYMQTYIDKPELWPFKNTSVEQFLQESERLLKLHHYRESRRLVPTNPTLKTSAEAYMDMTTGASFKMLKCIQALDFEAAEKEMFSLDKWDSGVPFDMSFDHGKEIARDVLAMFYKYNEEICDALAPELIAKGIAPRYIDMEKERNYVIDAESTFAVQAADNHYLALSAAYEEINNLIKYGLPADGFLMKLKDSVTGTGKIKINNQNIVNDLLNSEADLEIVEQYILPEIKKGLQIFKHKAKYEERHHVEKEDMQPGQMQASDPYFFRNGYKTYKEAQDAIKAALSQMQAKEAALKSSYVISIVKDPTNDTYTLTAKWTSGKKSTKQRQKRVTRKIIKSATVTKQKDYKEKSFSVKIGSSSRKMYEETRKRAACKLGYENVQELAGEKISISNTFKSHVLKREFKRHRKTEVAGKKESSQSAQFVIAEASDDIKYKRKREDQADKEFKIVGISTSVGSANASITTKHGIPVAKASTSLAGASAEALEMIKFSASAGSIGYSTDAALKDKVNNVLFDQILGDDTKVPDVIKEYAEGLLKKTTSVSINAPKISGSLSVGGITIDAASHDGKEAKFTHRLPEIEQAKADAIDKVHDWFDKSEADSDVPNDNPIGIDPDLLPDETMDMDAINDMDPLVTEIVTANPTTDEEEINLTR